jgi:hypothetical protein
MLIIISTTLTILALSAVNIYALYTHQKEAKEWAKERKDLYDRIMSKDLQEYKWNTGEPIVYAPVSNDDKELYEREIEEQKQ